MPTKNMSPQLFFSFYTHSRFILSHSLSFLPSSPPFLSLSILIHSNDFAAAYILCMILSYRCKFPTSYRTKWSGCAKVPRKMTTFSNKLIFPATLRLFSSIPYMNPSITIYWAIQVETSVILYFSSPTFSQSAQQ